MKLPIVLAMLLALFTSADQPTRRSADLRSFEQKLAYLKANAAKPQPDPRPVELTEAEVDAFFNEGGVKLPVGVSNVHLAAHPGQINGHADVDFEQIMQRHGGANNPLSALFTGRHNVHAVSHASGANGVGTVRIDSVELDGAQVPQWALEWFVQRYLTPRYPNVGMTSTFKLPLRINSAVIETGKVRVQQR